jgi:hypothetical protein
VPKNNSKALPGINLTKKKTNIETPNNTGIIDINLFKIYLPNFSPPKVGGIKIPPY